MRARAAERRLQLDTRRREYREPAVGAEQRTAAPSATEIAELRNRAEEAEGRADDLERALESNRRIGIAIGILLARPHRREEAFDVLRRGSMRRNVEVARLAEQVVHTGAL